MQKRNSYETWNYWELSKLFKKDEKRKLDVAAIACILTLNRCINPSSKSRVSKWLSSTTLKWQFNLDTIEDNKENICKYLFNA